MCGNGERACWGVEFAESQMLHAAIVRAAAPEHSSTKEIRLAAGEVEGEMEGRATPWPEEASKALLMA